MNFVTKISHFTLLAVVLCIITPIIGSLTMTKKRYPRPIKNVVFDLNGVLLKTNKMASFSMVKKSVISSILSFNNPFSIKKKLLSVLNKIKPRAADCAQAKTPEGDLMPQIMVDWQCGAISCKEFKKEISSFAFKNPDFFANKSEKNLILALSNLILTPELLAKTQQPIKEAIDFLKECKKNNFIIYVLSNFDSEGFEAVYNKYPQLFNLIDRKNIIVSGNVKTVKPDHKIYKHLLKTYNLDPQTCVFFDDRPENVIAAQECGMHSIQCHQKNKLFGSTANIKRMKKEFNQLLFNQPDYLIL